jgi:tetratricopeptide (TPR) repeat protein
LSGHITDVPPLDDDELLGRAQELIVATVASDGDRRALIEEVLKLYQQLGPVRAADKRVTVFRELARAVYPGNLSPLRPIADIALPAGATLSDRALEAALLNVKATVLKACGEYAAATRAFQESHQSAVTRADSMGEATALVGLGTLESTAGLQLTALNTFKRAKDRALAAGASHVTMVASYNLAHVCQLLGRKDGLMREALHGLAYVPAFPSQAQNCGAH